MQGSSGPDRELLDAAALCGHLLGEGSVHTFLAEHRHRLFPDEMFADLLPTRRGRPSVPADVVATMLVEQIRRVRRFVPELAGVPVREHNLAGGRPPCDWDDPADRDRLVSELVDDANELVWAAEDLDLSDAQADAVACWRWSPAKTSNRATGPAAGGSPSAPSATG
jgi:hypothetical protein